MTFLRAMLCGIGLILTLAGGIYVIAWLFAPRQN